MAEENSNNRHKPTRIEVSENGGIIEFKMPNTAGSAFGIYHFAWEFQDDISQMVEEKEYRFKLEGKRTSGTEDNNTATAYLISPSGGKLAKDLNIQTNEVSVGFKAKTNQISASSPNGQNLNGTVEVKKVGLKKVSLTLSFRFGSYPYGSNSQLYVHEVIYVYQPTIVKR